MNYYGFRAAGLIRSVLGWGLREIPRMPWSATRSRWEPRPSALVALVIGQWAFGTGEALLVDARLGNSPWTVLAQGISRHSGLSIGEATFVVSIAVLLFWVPLKERLGLGSLANAVIIAVAIDTMLPLLPEPGTVIFRLLEVLAGILSIGFGSFLYLSAHLGPGPRDGWMVGIARITHQPLPFVRLCLEASVLVAGWLLGGVVGVGTLLFALLVGHTIGLFLSVAERAGATAGRVQRSRAAQPQEELQ